ncbi:periplasmic dipeptide transport protein precursor [Variibacter gotjawalensis]|uniref:Periplasmic dipeptide transport protein n=1 Tax=Variibacter gotjawalensis TaxID=1333996 RepID=A0A0S3PXH3_9BRAD|nr:ABC transporter substrate-binding protein [Variibacter gotjawalensis]NIK46485.1 peptide/nickel transport system substrate-binding protein [Variibacter gotjawalensis]RZS48393.1 peptide/nickel transport system substrate-binding protein [Variibacter gotjawalensis]BAT60652.1 periplasmic dipeptide transport protein precursor [Variibacter gotjawalensis]
MKLRLALFAMATALLPALSLATAPANAVTFRYAFQGDLNSLDPYTLNETFALGAIGNVMEGLTKRDKDLKIIPGLAERWEILEPTKWRFYLRKNVKFHDGSPFTADDVVFSATRARADGSQVKTRLPADAKVVKVDDHTVDFILAQPNPILHYEWDTWYIFSKPWAEKVGATQPQSASSSSLNAWALTANGTGPFKLESHQPGVRTVYKTNTDWWGKKEHNLDEVIFTTIKSDATRVAALLSGEIDMMEPVPVQDVDRVKSSPNTTVATGPELRTIFLNMDSFRDELLYSNVKGKNPFKDARVRKAFYQAIDIEAIKSKVMRGMSTPSALLISPLLFSRSGEFKRHPYDPNAAKKLLTEAGYPNGFELTMDCPNDRYVNDEAICQAVTVMLARIGVKATLNAMPKAKFFEKAGPTAKYDSSFNMLGWTPGSFDSWNILGNISGCRDANGKPAQFNYGGYCNKEADALAEKILVETDTKKRDEMIYQAFKIVHEEAGVLPLHQQALAWGVSKKVNIAQRPDNQILFYWVNKN